MPKRNSSGANARRPKPACRRKDNFQQAKSTGCPAAHRWPKCSPCRKPASSVATAVWPPSARSGRPPHPHPSIPGGPHEAFSLGGDPPFARSGAVVAGSDGPTTALFPSYGPQGDARQDHGSSAAAVDPGAALYELFFGVAPNQQADVANLACHGEFHDGGNDGRARC